ncbi:MAG: DUF1508 domain-containing protein [Crocinitomix sp.]|nr:DUF1508 domain-containing protein [Crocinitomix sp.]
MSSQDHITISAKPSEKESKNFDLLREEGINYLQKVAGKIWTDYNLHDPGVTILEQLCYAINDIGYRANLDIKDLLAINEDDDTSADLNNFYTAREILTNAPFTKNDYRKLLIDCDGIKNAWFDITKKSEVDFYVDPNAKEITYIENAFTGKIDLNGLYDVLLEFDYSDEFGDLNDNTLVHEIEIETGDLKGLILEITIEFPYWDVEWETGKSWDDLIDVKESIKKIYIELNNSVKGFTIEIEVSPANVISVQVADSSGISFVDKPLLAAALKTTIDDLLDVAGAGDDNLLVQQQNKVAETLLLLDKAKAVLHENRNLCEDFVRFSALKIEEIAICADIELMADANTEEVLAEIYFLVGQFLAPDIHFYSFAEMLEKDNTTEEIFEGPRLDHGFIDTTELEASSRMKNIHVSDLISIIMDIEGVVAVKEIQIGSIPLGDSSVVAQSVLWCLELAWEKNFVPRISPEQSKIIFIKKGIPFIADEEIVEDLLEAKKAEVSAVNAVVTQPDLPVPNGLFYNLADYETIQTGFPENYGIGNVGLADSASDERKSQANQLKAYLLFFDQFLANYCSQLANVKELFSMNSDIDKTYFHQSLFDIPNGANLFKDFIDQAGLKSDPTKDSTDDVKLAWEAFKAKDQLITEQFLCDDAIEKSRADTLGCIIEGKEAFLKRRNMFLDHLLARFSEQFTDYAMLAYKMDGAKADQELIDDKLAFLQCYPELSYRRGQAFNYLKPAWDNDNVAGLQKKVASLLGIDNYNQRDLSCPPPLTNFIKFKDSDGKWRFRFVNKGNDILLKSEAYNSTSGRTTGIKSVLNNGITYANYDLLTAVDGKFYYNLVAQNGEIIGTSNLYETIAERDDALEQLVTILRGECSGEGFYLLEHILLRPRVAPEDDFLPVSFQEDCYCEGNEDAYSFRATCILPYWIGRFTNMDFRRFVERTIREETPAHIFMKICWIDQEHMSDFQVAHKAWLEALEPCPPIQTELTEKQNNLIAVLNTLRNVYPVSHLYDCQESQDSPVMLGQSILGTFIPNENE